MLSLPVLVIVAIVGVGFGTRPADAQPTQPPAASQREAAPAPTHANLEYAPAESAGKQRPQARPVHSGRQRPGPLPTVIWTGGSAWMADNGKDLAGQLAARLNPAGYAVAGVSIRSSSQVKFPGQLHDIKAAIRWLRANAAKYGLDPDRIAIVGDSSGGWTSSMAALTGDVPEIEGSVGVTGASSRVQAAVAFYPPTNFLTMDAWALNRCDPNGGMFGGPNGGPCHDGEASPESRLVGCAIQTCPDKVRAASPLQYVSAADPPMMILHGQSDQLVPHNQGEALYMALNKACKDAVFISLPKARHGPWNGFLTDDGLREAAVMRSTSAAGCKVVEPDAVHPDLADGHRFPRQVHEAMNRQHVSSVVAAVVLAAASWAVNGQQAPPAPTGARTIAEADCTPAKLGSTIPVSAIGLPVSAVTLDAPRWHAEANGLPAYCSVEGTMAPVDKSPTARPIRFGVALPAAWSGRGAQFGGGGMNGTIPRLTGGVGRTGAPLISQGFATYGSDSGHQAGFGPPPGAPRGARPRGRARSGACRREPHRQRARRGRRWDRRRRCHRPTPRRTTGRSTPRRWRISATCSSRRPTTRPWCSSSGPTARSLATTTSSATRRAAARR